jgi:hypothetical protein
MWQKKLSHNKKKRCGMYGVPRGAVEEKSYVIKPNNPADCNVSAREIASSP